MRKTLAAAIVLAVAVGGLSATVGAEDQPDKRPAEPAALETRPLSTGGGETAPQGEVFREFQAINCGTRMRNVAEVRRVLRCINRQLTKLNNKINALNSKTAGLRSDVDVLEDFKDCHFWTGVTQYGDPTSDQYGYMWSSDGVNWSFVTSALDFTLSGGTPDVKALVWGC